MLRRHGWKLGLLAVGLLVIAGMLVGTRTEETADLFVAPERGPFEVTVTATGELKAKNSVQIYGPSGARQARIFEIKILQLVPEGTVVEKGDFVANLDKSELTSRLQDTQLSLQQATSKYTQTKLDTSLTLSKARDELVNLQYAMEEARLRREQSAYEPPSTQRQTEIDYEKAERAHAQATKNYVTQQQQAEAQMQEVEAELGKAQNEHNNLVSLAGDFTVLAPENGMVIYRRDWRGQKTTAGGTVSAWDPVVAELPDLSVMESVTYVNEVDIQKIRPGQDVEIGLDADPEKTLSGVVTSVANIGEQRPNSDAKVFEVAIEVSQADSTLRPAMTTSNTIRVAQLTDALFVPLETIHAQDSLRFVFVQRGGRTERQEVRLGLINENEAVVEAGLDEDDRLFLSMPADTSGLTLSRLDPADVPAPAPDAVPGTDTAPIAGRP